MGMQWCHPDDNWGSQLATKLFIRRIDIVKGRCFDRVETKLILFGLACFQHFFSSSEKSTRIFAISSGVRRKGSLRVRNSHRKNVHGLSTSGSSLAFSHSFIFVSFKSSAAFTEIKALPAAAVNLLTSVEFSFSTLSQERLQNYSSCMFMQSKNL